MGLRAVEQVRRSVGSGPVIIGMGGIASPEHVEQYRAAGANLFGVGSALTGLDSGQMRDYLAHLQRDVARGTDCSCRRSCETQVPMDYVKTRVAANIRLGESLFKLTFERLPQPWKDGEMAGKFLFLCVPGVGEKPFAVFSCSERSVVVRTVGKFTAHLEGMAPGAEILLRGPYGKGVPEFEGRTIIHAGGGTGIASLLEIAMRLRAKNRQIFLLGARTREHLFDLEKFRELGPVFLATDDGTIGSRGYVSSLLSDALASVPAADTDKLIFINCGPEPMVRRCFDMQRELAPADCVIGSIEYMTSCGVGICGKCSSPSGALTCIDGPFLPCSEFDRLEACH
jgi:dihydroorotate dehydrogenase (NAD+) catalytic subunit